MGAWDLLWETRCAGCGEPGAGALCRHCAEDLELRWAERPVPGIRGAVGAAGYHTAIGGALRHAKYGGRLPAMRVLGEALACTAAPWLAGARFDAVIPAPSPWTRRLRRGFAPAAVLAGSVARRHRWPVVHALRLAPGRSNAGLSARGRRSNLRGRMRSTDAVRGRVLLVDDVVTTGATAAACARELLGSGADAVWLLCLCATAEAHP